MKIKIAIPVLLAALCLLVAGCATSNGNLKAGAFLAKDQKHYDSLGISREPAAREDGIRTSGKEQTYEWWYVDGEFDGGTKVVAAFYTKYKFDIKGPAHPTLTVDITLPDGQKISKEVSDERGTLIRAAHDKCDVKIRDSYIRITGEGNYEVHVVADDITFDCLMKPKIPMWRPATGFTYFGENMDKYLGWFVAVPSADLTARLAIGNDVKTLKGLGYHDHNWGNEEMNKIINHWYWGRVAFEDYTIIFDDFISEEKYGYNRIPIFMIAKEGKIIGNDEEAVKIIRSNTVQHPVTKKFMDNTLTFIKTTSDGTTYKIELNRKEDLIYSDLLEMSGLSKFMIGVARLMGANPTYVRVSGDATLTITKAAKESALTTSTIWEQMHFGSNKDAIIHDYSQKD